MSDETVTKLTIDADTSGADRFSQAMDQASASAQSGLSSAQGVSLAIAGVGTATVAVLAGLRAFVDYVGNQTQALVDLSDRAELAGVSVREFQATLYAAMSKGVSEKDFNAGIEKITADLTDAGRGVTQFGKLFEANGIAIKDANGQLITTKQAVSDLADLMARATPQQQQAMARIVGISQSWIPFLAQGSDAIEQQKQKAADLGIIIDESTIQKAREFNEQWKTATAAWDLQFKASLASILPLLTHLADLASSVINAVGSVTGDVARLLTPDDQKTTSQLNDQINEVERLVEIMQTLGEQSFRATNLKGALGLPEAADLQQVFGYMDKIIAQYDALNARIHVTAQSGTGINLPALSDARNLLDRAIISLQKHTAQTEADTQAVGLGAGALEEYRAQAVLLVAAEQSHVTVTQALADKFQDLAQDAGEAAQALAEQQAASKANFDLQSAGLTGIDAQIAQLQYKLHGDDWQAWMNDGTAATMRIADAIKQATSAGENFANTLINGLIQGKSGMEALQAAATSLGQALISGGLKTAISGIASGNLVQAAIGGGEVIGGALAEWFGGSSQAQKQLEQAQQAWAQMTTQVQNFNEAARGINLGPLTQQLQSLYASMEQIQQAAFKAHDVEGGTSAVNQFNSAVARITSTFAAGTSSLTPYQQAVKSVSDEAQGLIDTLVSIRYYTPAHEVGEALQTQLAAVAQQFVQSFSDGLRQRTNTANGQDYLNSAAGLLTQHQQDLLEAQQLGLSPDLANAAFAAEAQKIVNDAGLIGASFNTFIQQFPQFSGVVTESAAALQAAKDKFSALTKTINDYLASLAVGSNSILSPQDQLRQSEANFQQQFALAQGGDQTALGSITQYATTLLDQAKSFYASGAGYAGIYSTVVAALSSLTGTSSVSPTNTSLFGAPLASSSTSTAVVPQVTHLLPAGAANDNGAGISQQTQQLSQVFAQVGQAQIVALQTGVADLGKRLDRIALAVERQPKPARPNTKTGTS